MFNEEQRRVAIETFIRYDHSYADTVAELGYPSRATLRLWWREYESTGEIPKGKGTRQSKYTEEQMGNAVDYYLEHGRSLSRTMRALGYPKSRQTLGEHRVSSSPTFGWRVSRQPVLGEASLSPNNSASPRPLPFPELNTMGWRACLAASHCLMCGR